MDADIPLPVNRSVRQRYQGLHQLLEASEGKTCRKVKYNEYKERGRKGVQKDVQAIFQNPLKPLIPSER